MTVSISRWTGWNTFPVETPVKMQTCNSVVAPAKEKKPEASEGVISGRNRKEEKVVPGVKISRTPCNPGHYAEIITLAKTSGRLVKLRQRGGHKDPASVLRKHTFYRRLERW
jgi:hypothetical protein